LPHKKCSSQLAGNISPLQRPFGCYCSGKWSLFIARTVRSTRMHSVGRMQSSIEAASAAPHINISGLFHRAVSQSGTAFCSWALAPNGSSSHQTEKLAVQLGCPTQPSSALVSCLRTKDAVDITATDRVYMVSTCYVSFMSSPIQNIDPWASVSDRLNPQRIISHLAPHRRQDTCCAPHWPWRVRPLVSGFPPRRPMFEPR
jgi:hypothetical protein